MLVHLLEMKEVVTNYSYFTQNMPHAGVIKDKSWAQMRVGFPRQYLFKQDDSVHHENNDDGLL